MWRPLACAAPIACLFLSIPACDSTPSDPKSSANTNDLTGDWLPCVDTSCVELADDGYRLGADGSATRMNGTSSLAADAPICIEVGEAVGSYEFDGTQLTIEGLTVPASLEGDLLTLRDVPSGSSEGNTSYVTVVFIRLTTYVDTQCAGDPAPLPDL